MPISPAGIPGLMAGYLVKMTFVLTLALLAAAAARKRPAAFRHFILSFALIALLLLPVLTLVPVGWRSPLLPGWMASSAPLTTDASAREGRSGSVGAAAATEMSAEAGTTSSRRAAFPSDRSIVGGLTASLLPDPVGPEPTPLSSGPSSLAKKVPAEITGLLLAVLWATGLAVLLLRLGFGLAGAGRLTAEGTPLDDAAWRVLLERFLAFVSLRREVRLKSHPEVVMPLTWGFRKPIVLFPDGADAWTEDERSSALYHELSHIKRADFLAMLLVRTSLALFWWNPLCWVVYREILKEQEIACDELVLRAGIRPSTYAASLLAFRRSAGFRWSPSAALLGLLGRSSFQERLAAILKQKLTFMEVKMKSKIMLALALVLAVALIGTARPAGGVEKNAVATTVAETAMPAPVSLDAARTSPASQEVQAEKAVAQEKQKEQEKAKAAEKTKEAEKAAKEKAVIAKTIVIKSEGDEGKPIEITITEGDTTRTLVLDKSLTITKGKDGKVLVLTPEGKEPLVLEGEPLRLEIKGGGLQIIKEGKAIGVGEGGVYRIVKEGGEEGPTMTWVGKGGKAFAFSSARDEEMLKKVQALQEQVAAIKAKKMDISALEESLKKLEAELKAKEEKLKTFEYKFDKMPYEISFTKRIRGDEAEDKVDVRVDEKVKTTQTAKTRVFIGLDDKNGRTINLVSTGQDGEAGKAAFERAVANLKKEIPEGYTLVEQKYDEETGAMTFKIAVPEGKKADDALVRKLVEMLQAETKKK